MVGGRVDESRPGAVVINVSEGPSGLRDSLAAAGQPTSLVATFDLPARAGSVYLSRTHPFVEHWRPTSLMVRWILIWLLNERRRDVV